MRDTRPTTASQRWSAPSPRRLRLDAALSAAVLALLTGCGTADRAAEAGLTAETELTAAAEQLASAVRTAAGSLEGAERALADVTGMDAEEQPEVRSAIAQATAAIADARAAVRDADARVTEETRAAVDRASSSLTEAREAVDSAAGSAQGTLRDTLMALSDQLDRLAAELEPA